MQHPEKEDLDDETVPELLLSSMSEAWKIIADILADKGLPPIAKHVTAKMFKMEWTRTENYNGMMEIKSGLINEYTGSVWASAKITQYVEGLNEQSHPDLLLEAIGNLKYVDWMMKKHSEYQFCAESLVAPAEDFDWNWNPKDVEKKLSVLTKQLEPDKPLSLIKPAAIIKVKQYKDLVEIASDHAKHADTLASLRITVILKDAERLRLKRRCIELEANVERLSGRV